MDPALRKRYGNDNINGSDSVVATGHVTKLGKELLESGPFHFVDCTDIKAVEKLV